MGAGSARPVVSTTTRSSAGITPLASSSKSSRSASTRSSRVVQHTHPLSRRTVFSSARLRRWWSSPTLPNSLTITAVFSRDGAESTLESSVVLPLPRKPVMIVTGFFVALASVHRRITEERRVQGGVERVERSSGKLPGFEPQGAEVLHQRGASLAVAQDVLPAGPVLDPEAVEAQHLVRYGRPADTLAASEPLVVIPGARVLGGARPALSGPFRPVELGDELPTEHAHGL